MSRDGKLVGLVLVMLSIMLTGTNVVLGDLVSPVSVPYFAGPEHSSYPVTNMVDDNIETFGLINDDDPATEGMQGYLVFDMGAASPTAGIKLYSRWNNSGTNFPKNVDFFYYADDDPSNNAVLDDIEGDTDIVLILSYELSNLNWGNSETVSWTQTPSKRYVGMRINSSYSTNAQLGEVYLDAVPEPATLSLLAIGGLLSLVRRKK